MKKETQNLINSLKEFDAKFVESLNSAAEKLEQKADEIREKTDEKVTDFKNEYIKFKSKEPTLGNLLIKALKEDCDGIFLKCFGKTHETISKEQSERRLREMAIQAAKDVEEKEKEDKIKARAAAIENYRAIFPTLDEKDGLFYLLGYELHLDSFDILWTYVTWESGVGTFPFRVDTLSRLGELLKKYPL